MSPGPCGLELQPGPRGARRSSLLSGGDGPQQEEDLPKFSTARLRLLICLLRCLI